MPNVEPLREGDPTAVGPYRLAGRLGAGGQGVVYLGQARNGTAVAVKVLRDDLTGDDRLAGELAAARQVEPSGIARVLDASFSGRPYIVTEYVEGPSLQQAGRLTGVQVRLLAVATATALAAIHWAGVVHRDFKPSNVLLGRDGPRVTDFGIARALNQGMSATSSIVGTPAYMAPEQLAGQPVGAPSDVFSWASVIVFAATGVPPFGDDSLPAVINRILHDEPQIGELPEPLRSTVLACLVKDPARRPAMQDVLHHLAGGQTPAPTEGPVTGPFQPGREGPVTASPQPGGERPVSAPPKRGRRRRVKTVMIAGVSGLSALALAGAIVWLTPSTPQPRTRNLAGSSASTPPSATASPSRTRKKDHSPAPERTATEEPGADTTSEPSASTAAGRLRLRYVRAGGAMNGDCWAGGEVTLRALVERDGAPVSFSYVWIIDGKSVGRSTRFISEDGKQYLTSPRNLTGSGSTHNVTLRITSPVTQQRTIPVTLCPRQTY
ncbi:protein kinase [Nonomuraea sp. NPDC000554]|uniref:serine/threonine protein kinase n=1 Tax=Nonomuraea sp. NPDC000554 TaxID=3154259 RepID=UPI0033292C8C